MHNRSPLIWRIDIHVKMTVRALFGTGEEIPQAIGPPRGERVGRRRGAALQRWPGKDAENFGESLRRAGDSTNSATLCVRILPMMIVESAPESNV